MEIVYITAGVLAGLIVAYLFLTLKNQKKLTTIKQDFSVQEKLLEKQKTEAEKQGLIWEERFQGLKTEEETRKKR